MLNGANAARRGKNGMKEVRLSVYEIEPPGSARLSVY